jgi:hypothetical protein
MKNEMRSGIITKDGTFKLLRERDSSHDEKEDSDDDPWLKSIANDQK